MTNSPTKPFTPQNLILLLLTLFALSSCSNKKGDSPKKVAVVIGGTSLFGGRGSIMGTVQCAFIIGVLNSGLVLLNVSPFC
ncbi:hypothetical protein [Thalassobellus suaedae]|uniref:Lipoprotein n=1 Tax=Thalassobellus suaedae TaxID=3074124 RepID=A0ABY9Y085_9FLAO|nr:hypothetical protein RHP49_11320 [Flavobacteriaceae bacterium HL-DH10]